MAPHLLAQCPYSEGAVSLRSVPFDRDAMRGVLAAQTEFVWHRAWADPPQANEADPGNRLAVDLLGSQRGRQQSGDDRWVDAVVHQERRSTTLDSRGRLMPVPVRWHAA